MNSKDLFFTDTWTLFLDRDGVINRRIPDGYVTNWEEFHFLKDVLKALEMLSGVFGKILIVSNQQGVGKGIMSQAALDDVDRKMKEEIGRAGGRIDATYYSPHLAGDGHPDRKPGTGLGLRALKEFPSIDPGKSVMVGDTQSDMEFGRKLGMITVLITEDKNNNLTNADLVYSSLYSFASDLNKK